MRGVERVKVNACESLFKCPIECRWKGAEVVFILE